MKNLIFPFPLVAVILFFAGTVQAAPAKTPFFLSGVSSEITPMQGKGGKPAPTPTPKPRIGPPKSGDE